MSSLSWLMNNWDLDLNWDFERICGGFVKICELFCWMRSSGSEDRVGGVEMMEMMEMMENSTLYFGCLRG